MNSIGAEKQLGAQLQVYMQLKAERDDLPHPEIFGVTVPFGMLTTPGSAVVH
jgi:hypothetical protein